MKSLKSLAVLMSLGLLLMFTTRMKAMMAQDDSDSSQQSQSLSNTDQSSDQAISTDQSADQQSTAAPQAQSTDQSSDQTNNSAPAAAQQSTDQSSNSQLPQTASNVPLVGLMGVLSLIAAGAFGVLSKRSA